MKAGKLRGVKIVNDLLLQSEYVEIITQLLKEPYCIESVVKIVFISFCVRNESRSSYRNRKTNFVDVLLENLNIKFLSHPDELQAIFEVLNILKKCGWIITENGRITVLKELNNIKCENKFLASCKGKEVNPIVEVNKLDDKAFVEEVLRHV